MDLNLQNKIAFVTGSSKGIGLGISKILLSEGCNVILNGKNRTNLKKTAKSLNIADNYIVGDVTKPKICDNIAKKIIQKYRKLDVLICNVGSGNSVKPGMETEKDWKKMFDVNFQSAANIIKSCESILSKSKGTIVCISSIAGLEFTGAPITYSVSKSALNAYVRGISKHLATKGIRINAVVPGNIWFKDSVWDKKLKKNESQVKHFLESKVALKRLGKPQEVGNLVAFLASDCASFITGSIFVIDGGQIH